jgi:hypothetical protein
MRSKIKAKWIIKMPIGAEVLVKIGDKVKSDEIIAMVSPKKIETFNFSQFLGKFDNKKLDELNQKFKNNWVNSGELMCLVGGLFPNKICFPMSGNFIEIDEFGNLKIEKTDGEKTEVISPVNSNVVKIEVDKITLEFEAKEFKGNGIIEGKSWGEGIIQVIDEAKDLDFKLKGSILLTNNLSKSFLLKAEVVGVNAVVSDVIDMDREINIDLPILVLSKEDMGELLKYKGERKKMLVNSRVGRLLLVIE